MVASQSSLVAITEPLSVELAHLKMAFALEPTFFSVCPTYLAELLVEDVVKSPNRVSRWLLTYIPPSSVSTRRPRNDAVGPPAEDGLDVAW